MEIQSVVFGFNHTLSIESSMCEYCNKYPNDESNNGKVKMNFHSHFSDYSAHNSATTFDHMKKFIHWMYEGIFFIKDGIIYDTTYYHLLNKPTQPSRTSDVQDIIVTTFWSIKDRERISAAEAKRNKNDVIGTAIQELTANNKKEEQSAKQKKEKNAKHKQKNNHGNGGNESGQKEAGESSPSNSGGERSGGGDGGPGGGPINGSGDRGPGSGPNNHNTHSLVDDNENNIYWQSPEARKLFGFFDIDYGDVDVVEGLHKRIKFLKQVHQREDGYQLVIPMTEDVSLNVSSHNKFTIRNQYLFLLKAYEYALK